MTAYLVHRKDMPEIADSDPLLLARTVFYQMWQNKQSPYTALAEGDLVYIGDPKRRRVFWVGRVDKLLTDFPYVGHPQALRALRKAYGLYPEDLNDYHKRRPSTGWLLAWSPRVLVRLGPDGRELPEGIKFGRNGYRALTESEAASIADPASLPDEPLASPPSWYDATRPRRKRAPDVSRYIPEHVVRRVEERDRKRCAVCGATGDLHLDHIKPHSHGGPSTVDNLRLLCADSNLSKGAGDPDTAVRCEVWRRAREHAGEEFRSAEGMPFTYRVESKVIRFTPDTPGSVVVNRRTLLDAARRAPRALEGRYSDQDAGPCLAALLADRRITGDSEQADRNRGGRAPRSLAERWRRWPWPRSA